MGNDNQSDYLIYERNYWNTVSRCRSEVLDTASCTRRWVQNRDNLICALGNIAFTPREDKRKEKERWCVGGGSGAVGCGGGAVAVAEEGGGVAEGAAATAADAYQPGNNVLSPCPSCGRKFSHEASTRHFPICARIKEKAISRSLKRAPLGMKMKSPEMDKHSSSSSACTVTLVPCSTCGKSFHSQDIVRHVKVCDGKLALNLARDDLDPREKEGGWKWSSQRSLIPRLTPKPSKEEGVKAVACPVCSRKFSSKYASRHIPLCSRNKKAQEAHRVKVEGSRMSPPPSRKNDKSWRVAGEVERGHRQLNPQTPSKDESTTATTDRYLRDSPSLPSEDFKICCNCNQDIPKKMEKDHTAVCAKLKAAELALKSKHSCCSKIPKKKCDRRRPERCVSRKESCVTVDTCNSLVEDSHGFKTRSEGECSAPAELPGTFTGNYCPYCGIQLHRETSHTHVELCRRLGKLEEILTKRENGNDCGDPILYKLTKHCESLVAVPLAVLPCPCCKMVLDISRI